MKATLLVKALLDEAYSFPDMGEQEKPEHWDVPEDDPDSAESFLKELVTPPKLESITVVGRRWFDRTYGNTYHTASIYVNGKLVHTTPMHYGYGNQYLWTAFGWLEEEGYLALERYTHSRESPWDAAERLGFELEYYANDVKRKRDL